ncbi:uncharacterized protein LOC130993791 [Salvia miltiorrhiza]|uniref:uncharacterized protein LOC130993791 n=1 Tax=Salvia miltiorrhiza TaxID=226208 RepID=UPI0025AD85E3|nr:uncharacterized protein LOC130993791 [Salvia miltiorrhiza]
MAWNVRGLTDESRRILKEHCCSFNPLIIGILEPKVAFHKVPLAFWNSINMTPCHQNNRNNRCSNIWVFSHPSVRTSVIFTSDQSVILDCRWNNLDFRIAMVHGSNCHIARRQLWVDLLNHIHGAMIFMGDFNAITGAHERLSTVVPNRSSCKEFRQFIDASHFIESPTSGLFYTWSGRLPHHVESVLDRVLFSEDFAGLWDSVNTHALPRVSSDHSPLILQCKNDVVAHRHHFRFFAMWTSHPSFLEVVRISWQQLGDTNCPIFRVMMKLKRLRGVLKKWNKEVFGNVNTAIQDSSAILLEIQEQIAREGYTDDLFKAEVAAQAEINISLSRKDNLLKQKSRVNWLHDGDRNSSFFHNMIKFRKNKLHIGHLNINGILETDQAVIEQHVVSYFSHLFAEDNDRQVDLVELEATIDHFVTEDQNDELLAIPNDVEIAAAVHDLDASSAPGPDGFSGEFFRTCWAIIQKDITCAVRGFFINSYLPAGCNANNLILIPKKNNITTVEDLRPIIISNFLFKVISKILASRLSKIASVGVSGNQFGFIAGRSIHDCTMMGSEGFNCMKRTSRGSNMACKIDIRKAFDTMNWNFIIQVLRANGFHEKFLNWISIIFKSARISILYNGRTSGYFACSRGVRQGDPLSPILFGLAEDVLSHLITNCVSANQLMPMSFSRATFFPTHLFYADDIIIFCRASARNARKIKEILHYYASLSGQICSNEKSSLFLGPGVSSTMGRSLQRELGFAISKLPVTYLGVPLFIGCPRASHFAHIKDRILQKFDSWQGRQLSMAGRLCLVKSVIQSSIVHSMMTFRWPKSLLHEIDKKCRNFIWTGRIDKRPVCSVSWNRLTSLKEEGGLGIRSFTIMNKSFLMKAAWKLIKGEDWAYNLLRTRYLTRFGYAKPNIAASSVWSGLKSEIAELVNNSYAYVGSGDYTLFWIDNWLGYKLVDKLAVPSFMHCYLTQSVADYFFDGVWHFTADFIESFPDIVYDILILPVGNDTDTRFWKHSLRGEVSAALAFAAHSHRFPSVSWGKWLWAPFIPVRRSLVCWRIIHRRLPTLDCLIRNGLTAPNWCSLCQRDSETIDHIFWSCDAVRSAWGEFLSWFGQESLLECHDIHTLLIAAMKVDFSSQIHNFWKAGLICMLWIIWQGRNNAIFENIVFNHRHVLRMIKVSFQEMDANFPRLGTISNSWSDFLIVRNIGVQSRFAAPPEVINVNWWPPAHPWIKVNTDGSALGAPGAISAGGVFRDNWCHVRGCFHTKGGIGFAFEAELLAVITAISIAHARNWFSLWIEADSTYVVGLLQSRSCDVPWRFMSSWKKTLVLLNDFQIRVSHIYREGNAAADVMANYEREEGWWPFAVDAVRGPVESLVMEEGSCRSAFGFRTSTSFELFLVIFSSNTWYAWPAVDLVFVLGVSSRALALRWRLICLDDVFGYGKHHDQRLLKALSWFSSVPFPRAGGVHELLLLFEQLTFLEAGWCSDVARFPFSDKLSHGGLGAMVWPELPKPLSALFVFSCLVLC